MDFGKKIILIFRNFIASTLITVGTDRQFVGSTVTTVRHKKPPNCPCHYNITLHTYTSGGREETLELLRHTHVYMKGKEGEREKGILVSP